ncbi:uncharacterized protein LOC134623404 [Pelmatolapia mariae]|uniref:uncharacterized protein LOC134623404 n=1 Tax=Pelmatolapia mariae TaxID=158779 RepID=UPI003211E193
MASRTAPQPHEVMEPIDVSSIGSCSGSFHDTERAVQVMEACRAGAADGVKGRAERLLNIFQSDLFQALLAHSLHSTPRHQGNRSGSRTSVRT